MSVQASCGLMYMGVHICMHCLRRNMHAYTHSECCIYMERRAWQATRRVQVRNIVTKLMSCLQTQIASLAWLHTVFTTAAMIQALHQALQISVSLGACEIESTNKTRIANQTVPVRTWLHSFMPQVLTNKDKQIQISRFWLPCIFIAAIMRIA